MRRYVAGLLLVLLVAQSSGTAVASTGPGMSDWRSDFGSLAAPLLATIQSTQLVAQLTGNGDRYTAMHAPPPHISRPASHIDAAAFVMGAHALKPVVRVGVPDHVIMPPLSALNPHHRRLDPLAMRRSVLPPKSESIAPSSSLIEPSRSLLTAAAPPASQKTHGIQAAKQHQKAVAQPMTSSALGTGIEHWWTYEERAIPGIGKAMVNVGTGNLIVSAMDVDIPGTGIDLAFQRVYNMQSLHDYNGDDGGDRSIFGNRWTNDLDANMVYDSTANTITVYDIDGTPCVYTSNTDGSWKPCTGEYSTLAPTDGTDCTYAWTKKTGTIYWFHADNNGGSCGLSQAKKGHLQEILARNNNNNITFTYSYDGAGKGPEDVTEIDANHSDGQELRMVFGIVPGTSINELSTITRPDGAQLQYLYDASGNLLRVDKPGNNTPTPTAPAGSASVLAGDLPETYAYASGTSSLQEACGPVCTIANWNHPGSADRGAALLFSVDGSLRLTQWQVDGVLNYTPGDGTNSPLHSGLSQAFQVWYTANFVYTAGSSPCGTTIASTTTMCDTDNHSTVWTTDSSSRVTQTQEWTGTNEAIYLVTGEGWDANNNLTSTTDARNHTTQYSYDGNGNTTEVALPSPATGAAGQGPVSMYSYDSSNNVLSYCDPVYNANHNNSTCPTGRTSGPTASFTYDSTYNSEPFGVLTKIYSALGYERDIFYNAANQGAGGTQVGLPTSEIGNGGTAIPQADHTTRTPTQIFTYDNHGNLQTYSKGENIWTMSYDSLNRETIRSDGDTYTGFPAAGISSYTCYYLDGSVAYTESASQHSADGTGNTCPTPVTAPTYATASTYDADGDQTGLVDHKGGGTGTTTKYYDGLDRLVEVVMPYDNRFSNEYFGFSWMTRYQYDLTQGVGTVNIAAKNAVAYGLGYGGLYKTQEYLPNYLVQPGGSIGSGNWTDVRGNFFDGMDRSAAKYETAFSDSAAAEVLNTYDTNGYLGLLTKMANGASQFIKYAYDDTNRKSQLTLNNNYTPGGGVSPPANDSRTYVYDPDSRPTSISNNMGSVTYSYDADGRTTNINEPSSEDGASTICYAYYVDGMREYVSTGTTCPSGNSGQHGISQANIFSYSYRKDGLLQNQAVNWSATGSPSFSWTYTPGGRELTQNDPLTGTKVPELTNNQQIGGATWTYEPKSYTYDAFGRPSTLTVPEGYTEGSGANPITYDRDDEVTGFNQYNNGFCTTGCQQANGIARQFTLNTRGEMLEDNVPAIPNSGIFQQSANGYLENGVEWDTRSNMMYSQPFWFPVQGQAPQYGSQNFIYDAAGRQATGWYSYTQLLPPPVQTPPNGALYVYTRSYDAENHVVNAPAPSSIDANANNNCGYQCAPDATFTWGPDGHLRTISGSGFQTGLHYDGDTILFGSNSQGPVLHLGTMGTLTAAGTFTIMDRDGSGTQQAVHGATWFGQWNLGPAIPRFGKSTVNVTLAPGSCAPDQNGQNGNCPAYGSSGGGYVAQARTDGYTYGTYTFQGVRIFDSNSSQWLTPDANAGIVQDPMSQKPFLWNENNPLQFNDPSGYVAEVSQTPDTGTPGVVDVTIKLYVKFDGDKDSQATEEQVIDEIQKKWTGAFGNYNVTTTVVTNLTGVKQSDINRITISSGGPSAPFGVDQLNNHMVIGDKDTNAGWAHEAGHLMGLPDMYYSAKTFPLSHEPNPNYGSPLPGHDRDIMAVQGGVVTSYDIMTILGSVR